MPLPAFGTLAAMPLLAGAGVPGITAAAGTGAAAAGGLGSTLGGIGMLAGGLGSAHRPPAAGRRLTGRGIAHP